MIHNITSHMKTLRITSLEALDSAVAEVVRQRILHTRAAAARDAALAAVEHRHQEGLTALATQITLLEAGIRDFCEARRPELFAVRKSRETNLAEFGFELTPPRVETANKKVKWREVASRLLGLDWGAAYLRQNEPQPDKQALLADRERLTAEQRAAAGIQFCQDEQFFIRPKPETAQ
jgi:phage host-nuclease inhibitor protein Gam